MDGMDLTDGDFLRDNFFDRNRYDNLADGIALHGTPWVFTDPDDTG